MLPVNPNAPVDARIRAVPETKYLNADNVARYRLIMRFFYDNYRKLKYWLKPEEVFEAVSATGLVSEYTLELCRQDLEVLTEWKNLAKRHDGGRAATIEEYLRKRFRYQMTRYAVEIERMLEALENLQGYGGSLEPTLLERLAGYLRTVVERDTAFTPDEAGRLWRDIQEAFRNLQENASDYLASLHSGRAEELMVTEQFLPFKDRLTHYLQNFMVGLQKYAPQIEGILRRTDPDRWEQFLHAVVQADLLMPSLEESFTEEEQLCRRREEWAVFVQWFTGTDREESDVADLERETKNAIARVVRMAVAIQERRRVGLSRRQELDDLGQWFFRIDSRAEADKLAAYAFGLFRAHHFQGEPQRISDAGDLSMWDQPPQVRALGSRSRARRRAGSAEPVRDTRREQAETRALVLARKAAESEVVARFLELGEFDLSELDRLTPFHRQVLLQWLSRCLSNVSRTAHTPEGLEVHISDPPDRRRTVLQFEDGEMSLPDFHVRVREVTAR